MLIEYVSEAVSESRQLLERKEWRPVKIGKKRKKTGRRKDGASWITETKMDEMSTGKVKRGNEGLALRKDRRVFLRGCAKLPSSAVEFE